MRGGKPDAHTTIATIIRDHFADGPRRYRCSAGRYSWQSRYQYHPTSHHPLFTLCLACTWLVVLLGIGVSVWQVRREALSPSLTPPTRQKVVPSPSATTTQPQNTSSDYHSCVLSYATEDQAFAEKLYADLQSKGVSCWFAPHDLKTGDKLRTQIYEAIQKQDKLLLILSERAVKSDWVEREVELAFERERQPPGTLVLFPIRLDDAVMQTNTAWAGDIRRIRFIGDFRLW